MVETRLERPRDVLADAAGQFSARRSLSDVAPEQSIRPGIPFIFAFAFPTPPTRMATIVPGAITSIDVAGARHPYDPGDWFGARVPAIPHVTGPIAVAGVSPGDLLEIELLALEPQGWCGPTPLLVTIAIAAVRDEGDLLQADIPVGGLVRLPVRRPGGPISFGPVQAGQHVDREHGSTPVPARLSIRATVARPQSTRQGS